MRFQPNTPDRPNHRGENQATGNAMVRVAWALPNYGPIFSQVYASHLSAAAVASRTMEVRRMGDIPMLGATDRMYITSACNTIVKEALKAGDITHIFWVESDMIIPPDTLPKLLDVGKPIVSGVYFLRGGTGQPCLYAPTPLESKENPYLHTPLAVYDERGPFKIARYGGCPGMGCVLMDIDVFKNIPEPWFDLKANDAESKTGYGQDLYFYTKVRWAKYEVWVNPDVICDQIDTYITGYADYRKRLAEGKSVGAGGFIGVDAQRHNQD